MAETVEYEGIRYTHNGGVLTGVERLPGSPTSIKLPELYEIGFEIIEIGPFAFTKDTGVETLTLVSTVKTIRNKAFYFCTSLRSLTIGSGLESIERYAFAGCNNLEEIAGRSSTFSVRNKMLYKGNAIVLGINKPRVVMAETTTAISERAFSFCDKISDLTILDTVTEIGRYAFSDCSGLRKVTVPSSVKEVGYGAFFGCDNVESASIASGVRKLDGLSFAGMTGLAVVMLPSSVTEISATVGEEAFAGCRSGLFFGLTDDEATYDEAALDRLPTQNIGSLTGTVQIVFHLGGTEYDAGKLSAGASYGPLVAAAEAELGNQYLTIDGWYFDDGTFQHQCSGSDVVVNYEIRNGVLYPVSRIDVYAKYTAQTFTITLDIGYNGLQTTIDPPPKYGDRINVKDFYSPSRMMYNFDGWYGEKQGEEYSEPLTDNETGDTWIVVTGDCTIYAKWTSLLEGVYETEVNDKGEATLVKVRDWNAVYGVGGSVAIPASVYGGFKTDEDGNAVLDENGNQIEVWYPVVSIGQRLFENTDNTKSVVFPASVRSIGSRAFSNCANLSGFSFSLEDGETPSLSNIGSRAFEGTAIETLSFPDSVSTIRQGAFFNCQKLTSVTFGKGISKIGMDGGNNRGTFEDCDALVTVRIPTLSDWLDISFGNSACNPLSNGGTLYVGTSAYSAVTSLDSGNLMSADEIPAFAFVGNGCIETVDLSGTLVHRVGEEAFSASEKLSSVNLKNGIFDSIGRAAFSNCGAIDDITIPSTTRFIEGFAFNGCEGLFTVTIEEGCRVIGPSMFSHCTNLDRIAIPDSVVGIGASAFSMDRNLVAVMFSTSEGSKCRTIGQYAFYGCEFLFVVVCLDGRTEDDLEDESVRQELRGFPESLMRIGEHAFDRCPYLERELGRVAHGVWILKGG